MNMNATELDGVLSESWQDSALVERQIKVEVYDTQVRDVSFEEKETSILSTKSIASTEVNVSSSIEKNRLQSQVVVLFPGLPIKADENINANQLSECSSDSDDYFIEDLHLKTCIKSETTSLEGEAGKLLFTKFSEDTIKEDFTKTKFLIREEVDVKSEDERTCQSNIKVERDETEKWHHTSNKTGSLDDIGVSELKGKRAGTEQLFLPKNLTEVPCFQCPVCSYKTKHKWYLMGRHMSTHTKDLPMHKCRLCSYESPSKSNLSRHLQHRHKSEYIELVRCSEEGCLFKTRGKWNLARHVSRMHKCNQIFKCLKCSYETKYMQHIQTHQLKHESRDKWFSCPFCPYKTPYKYDLNRHDLIHKNDNEIKWFRCSECSFKTKRNLGLKRHKLCHLQILDKPFKCSECCYKTAVAKYFRQHSLKHKHPNSETWFKCCNCPYKTARKSDLKQHSYIHKSTYEIQEWFRCPTCPYKSHSKSYVKKHQVVHRKFEEEVCCYLCMWKSHSKTNLVNHIRVRHRDSEGRISSDLWTDDK